MKIIPAKIIKSCAECGYKSNYFTGTVDNLRPHCFYKKTTPHILDKLDTIPSWCPLKDYKGWQDKPDILTKIIEDTKLLDLGRKAVEDELIEWRDNRLSQFNRGNGLVIREKNGDDSSIIRFGMEVALKIALKAIYKNLSGHKAILPEE